MKKIFGLSALVLFMIYSSCNSTRLVSSWKAPESTLNKYNRILVIGLMGAKDREIRESVENAMVTNLQSHGINAGSAYAEYGPAAFNKMEEKDVANKIKNKGYDGVFTIVLLDKEKEFNYTPSMINYTPYTYYNRFWGYYQTMYARIYTPGYYTVSTNYMLEGNFYYLAEDKLEYSAQTRSFDPSSAQKLALEFSNIVVEDMIKKQIIQQ
ncbi:hypothetical protein [Pseudopedobacter saltans]|nr:hypothetical protein [Pseudopedobacter saltans]